MGTGLLSQSCTPREPGIKEKVNMASDKLDVCTSLVEAIKRKLFSEEAVKAENRGYPDCLEGYVESIRDRLCELENTLTLINDRL